MSRRNTKRVGVLWRADRSTLLAESRYASVGDALTRQGLEVEGVPFTDEATNEVRKQVLGLDAVLVWVDPISGEKDRSHLDPLLRDAASQGVWVSTHPDVILKMGTKDVLVKTRDMAWGTDCHLHRSLAEMVSGLTYRLAAGPRVLKQHRGNGGDGVWKVQLLGQESIGPTSRVQVLHAQRGSSLEEMPLGEFMDRCAAYFANDGCMVDQPYQTRLGDGMIRCYIVRDQVAGFGQQFVTALLQPPKGTFESLLPPPRLYYGPSNPEFQAIKAKLEGGWIREMQQILDVRPDELPVLWDADFLYGPKDDYGADTYVLCEINVSCVSPFPEEALEPLARAVTSRLAATP